MTRRRKTPREYHALAQEKGFIWLGPEAPNVHEKTWWECGEGHRWATRYNVIFGGHGCPQCKGPHSSHWRRDKRRSTFIKRAKDIHGDRYDYSKIGFDAPEDKVEIICPNHGSFWQTPYHHIRRENGCPECQASQGEQRIASILKEWGVNYEYQKRFTDCRRKYPLPFDFYVKVEGIEFLIEFDGGYHSEIVKSRGERELQDIKRRDAIKNKFARENGLVLIRISYKDIHSIDAILRSALGHHIP